MAQKDSGFLASEVQEVLSREALVWGLSRWTQGLPQDEIDFPPGCRLCTNYTVLCRVPPGSEANGIDGAYFVRYVYILFNPLVGSRTEVREEANTDSDVLPGVCVSLI